MRFKSRSSVPLLLLALAACRRPAPPAALSNLDLIRSATGGDVAQVCSSAETEDSLKALFLRRIESMTALSKAGETRPGPSKAALRVQDALSEGLRVTLDEPVPTGFDEDRRRLSCMARISFAWPSALTARLKTIDPGGDWADAADQADYTVRPNVSQTALVYTLAGPAYDQATETARLMVRAFAKGPRPARSEAPPSGASKAETAAAREAADQDYVDAAGDTSARRSSDAPSPPQ